MSRIVPLEDGGDTESFGGKSASLARSVAAGLPVPPGLSLDVSAVESVVRGDAPALAALQDVVPDLGGSVAVRSSAVGEDDQESSFAGQHATLLNVRTYDDLINAIHEVYRSAHSASALAYRQRLGIDGEPRIGVIVQKLVNADAAGVLFTHHPATGAEERLIEAAWGLGEAVVSGIVIPDSYRIDPNGLVLERHPGEKGVELRPGGHGGIEEIAVETERVRALCLSDPDLHALHELTVMCEGEYGARLDIEWAFADQRLYLLQCRAITR